MVIEFLDTEALQGLEMYTRMTVFYTGQAHIEHQCGDEWFYNSGRVTAQLVPRLFW